MRGFIAVALISVGTTGCGYNTIQTNDEAANSAPPVQASKSSAAKPIVDPAPLRIEAACASVRGSTRSK